MKGPPAIPSRHATLVHALAAAARSDVGVTFLDAREAEHPLPYREVHVRAARLAGRLARLGVRPGDRVALVLPTAPSFLDAFFGAMLAGAIPVPLYPPVRLGRLEEFHARTARLIERVGARLVLTDGRIRRLLGVAASRARPGLGCLTADDLPAAAPLEHAPAPADVAFIQYSSGTTVDPKPVALTHANVLANVAALESFFPEDGPVRQGGVSWLPLYHDMGLVGCLLLAVYHPGPLALIPPELFLARPAIWLRAISRARATISPAPSFAYGLCVKRVRDEELEGVDLSTWRYALNGAESIAPSVLEAFTSRFARAGLPPEALTPVYGLSEATLAVTFSEPRRPFRLERVDRSRLAGEGVVVAGDRPVVSVGTPLPGLTVEVRGEDGRELPEDRVGRIHVRGPSVSGGYFGGPPAGDPFLDTGDLGFVRGGELFVCGRAKDVVILRGANHAPQEFEDCLAGVAGLRAGCSVAIGVDRGDGEDLVVLAEIEGAARPGLEDAVRAAIVERTAIRPAEVHLLAPGTLPRTSSGKLRRSEARRQLLAGELAPPDPAGVLRIAREVLRSTVALARSRMGA